MKKYLNYIEVWNLVLWLRFYLCIFFTFPFFVLILGGMVSARELWSFVGFTAYLWVLVIPLFLISPWKKKYRAILIALWITILCFGVRIITLPEISVNQWKKLESVFLQWASPLRYSLWFFFSERDLIRMGSDVILGFFPTGKTLMIKEAIAKRYDLMAQDVDFWTIWSEYSRSFDDIIGIQHEGIHYYRYTPSKWGSNRLVVFLHGAAGNFMMYPWMFWNLSEQSNSTMVYVSYGYGDWDKKQASETIKTIIDNELSTWKTKHPEAQNDPEVTLVALSRGWLGITRFIEQYPKVIQYMVPISAVLEPEIIGTQAFKDSLKFTKVFIFHGKQDDNVSIEWAYFLEKVAKENAISIKTLYPEQWDHFMMFDEQKEFDRNIIEMWNK